MSVGRRDGVRVGLRAGARVRVRVKVGMRVRARAGRGEGEGRGWHGGVSTQFSCSRQLTAKTHMRRPRSSCAHSAVASVASVACV